MLIKERPTIAKIKLKNLINNINIIKNLINSTTKIIAVVKANAYGHGAVEISKFLNKNGINFFAVASHDEAKELFEANIKAKVLNFGKIYKKDVELAKKYDYVLSITSFDCFNYFSKDDKFEIHINIDTGMGRCGIFVEDLPFLIEKLKSYNLNLTGIYSHFPAADENIDFTEKQIKIFERVKKIFIEKGFKNLKFHISNSDGIINFKEANFDYVRPGIMLYGSYWNKEKKIELGLKPVMEFSSRIIDIKTFYKNQTIGYKQTFKVPFNNFKAGLVPVGYADGYPRNLSHKGEVLINNKKVPILGLVSMDWIIIDLNDIDAKIGDEVTLFGDDNFFIDVDNIASKMGTISYEVLTGIGKRVKRIYSYD